MPHRVIAMRSLPTRSALDTLTTEQVLEIYERIFSPLDPATKRRIVEHARGQGWDRSWELYDLIAA